MAFSNEQATCFISQGYGDPGGDKVSDSEFLNKMSKGLGKLSYF